MENHTDHIGIIGQALVIQTPNLGICLIWSRMMSKRMWDIDVVSLIYSPCSSSYADLVCRSVPMIKCLHCRLSWISFRLHHQCMTLTIFVGRNTWSIRESKTSTADLKTVEIVDGATKPKPGNCFADEHNWIKGVLYNSDHQPSLSKLTTATFAPWGFVWLWGLATFSFADFIKFDEETGATYSGEIEYEKSRTGM